MASELTRTPGPHRRVDSPEPAESAADRSRRRRRALVRICICGVLSGLAVLAALLTGWSQRRIGDGMGLVLVVTVLLVLVVAVPVIALSGRLLRTTGARSPRTAHATGRGPRRPARVVRQTRRLVPTAPTPTLTSAGSDDPGNAPTDAPTGRTPAARLRRGTVLTDQADVVAACDTALASRDLIGGEVALVVLDVMGLDRLRTLLGPTGVEDVARQTLRRLRAWLPPQDSVARLGPSSFAVLLEGLGSEGPAPQVARLTALLGEPMGSSGQTVEVDFAVGTALSGPDSTAGEMLLRAARAAAGDSARRADPAQTRPSQSPAGSAEQRQTEENRAEQHRGERFRAADGVARLAADLGATLRQGGLQAAFRPIVRLDSDSDRMIAIQALPRWVSPGGQDVPPEQLDVLAAQHDLSAALCRQLLERGLDAVAAWYAAGFAIGRLAVPMSAEELSDADLPDRVAAQLARRQLPGTALVIEVDAASVSDGRTARSALTRLRDQGAEVILTGVVAPQAALGLLTTLPLSGISLHRSLTEVLTEHPVPATAIVASCHQLGLRTLAEHVTTPGQLQAARECGIDAAWGPAIAAPARARDISARYSAARSLALLG